MTIVKNGKKIDTLEDWKEYAGPKSRDQWVDGRSAKEAARMWLGAGLGNLPQELVDLLDSHPDFGRVTCWLAEPEARLHFDHFPGETRNSDLAIYAEDSHGKLFIAVEAKADETFSELVADTLAEALERKLKSDKSNGLLRVEQLAKSLFGRNQGREPHLGKLRYQLLTACAGAICEGYRSGCSRTLLLVQEFVTTETGDEKHDNNARDLDLFVQRLSHGKVHKVDSGAIVGPFKVLGEPLFEPGSEIYLGKITHNLRH